MQSKIALVVDANTSQELLAKDANRVVPIASITKLMTAMVVLDAKPPMEEMLKISDDDRDLVMGTSSRLHVGWAVEPGRHAALGVDVFGKPRRCRPQPLLSWRAARIH